MYMDIFFSEMTRIVLNLWFFLYICTKTII